MNLAVNARDAMPDGGKLTVELGNAQLDEEYARKHSGAHSGPHVMLAVSDNGSGMDKETLSRIFEPFFTTKERGKGTGLGLSTVYGIVKQSGGNIYVYSEPGKGTTFKVYLPMVDASAEHAAKAERPRAAAGGSETILVAEDEDAVRNLILRVLRRSGYNLLEARTPEEAIKVCEQYKGKIQLLLTDVILPKMDGRALSKRLAEMHPEMKVIFMSGYTNNVVVHHGMLDEGIEFMEKPLTPDTISQKVRAVLDA